MTYPTIVSSTGMSSAGNSSPYSVTLPSPINAGNTIVVVLEIANGIAITPPAGFTEKLDASPGLGARIGVYTKTADGTEDGTSISFTNGSTGECKYQAYALDSTTGSVETATGYTSFGANDPPSITPSWSGDTLYLAAIFNTGGSGNPSAAPSGYSGYSEHENAIGDAAIAYKTGSGTENPGAFTASSAIWANLTVAIQGSTATAANNIFFGCNF